MQEKNDSKEVIKDNNGEILAVVIDTNSTNAKKEFHTPNDFSLQVGTFNLEKNESLQRHVHLKHERTIYNTSEVLYIQEGKLNVEIFDSLKVHIINKTLYPGFLIIFCNGGHSFKMHEKTKFIEIKQGPYAEELDKEKF